MTPEQINEAVHPDAAREALGVFWMQLRGSRVPIATFGRDEVPAMQYAILAAVAWKERQDASDRAAEKRSKAAEAEMEAIRRTRRHLEEQGR
jgi:hypothetical protein